MTPGLQKMKRILLGITGASGVIYGIRFLELLRGRAEVHLIITDAAEEVIRLETGLDRLSVEKYADYKYSNNDLSAPVASGSYKFDIMVILPCSIKSLSAIVNSYADTLLARASDVALKECRGLVLCVREMPFHRGHLELMLRAASMGAVICPPVPGFYGNPGSVQDIIDFVVGKVMNLIGVEQDILQPWGSIG